MHWLDAWYLRLSRRQPLFEGGWGELNGPLEVAAGLKARSTPDPLSLTFLATSPLEEDAFAASPAPLLAGPPGTLHVRRLKAKGPLRARVVVPPSWGDEGFSMRAHLTSPLRSLGVEVWLLEGAYFGSRRAVGQRGVGLETVGDFLRMGLANVLETRALVMTALEARPRVNVGLAGYSMAGQMCAHAAASLGVEVPATLMAPADDASVVFCDGPLSKSVQWNRLEDAGRVRLRDTLRALSVLEQPRPLSSKNRVVGTRTDGIVPPASMAAIARHWGLEVEWLDSGHLGGFAFHRAELTRAMARTLT